MNNELDHELEVLLDLDGYQTTLKDGRHWVKFEVAITAANENIPHGIRYSLTLHDEKGLRILGYDNSNHDYRPESKRKYVAKRIEWDHRHFMETVTAYDFSSPGDLMTDFWDDVYRIIAKRGFKK